MVNLSFLGANTNGLPYDSGSRNRTPQSSKRDLTKADQLGDGDEEVGLKQQVGLVSGVALIVGTMIGKSNIPLQGRIQDFWKGVQDFSN